MTANLPSGWNLVSLYELAEKQKAKFDDGDWIEAEHITDRGVRLVQTGNIGIGRFVEKDIKKYIFQSSYEKLKCKQLHIGDLLICRLAEPAGRACVFPDIGEEKVVTSVDVTIFRPEAEKVDRRYLVQYLSTPAWFDAVIEQVGGTTHKRIARSALGNISIPLPVEISEQNLIATALSDVDALIAGLEKLIAKKRDLKQAAMQQLLTGQTRLPGFSGEWVKKALGDITNIKTGSRNNEDKVEAGFYPFFVRSAHVERINSYSHECEAILVPGEGQIGEIFHYINGRFDVHQRVYAITQFVEGVSGKYIHLYMSQHFGAWAMQNTVKATVDSLRLPTFQTFEVQLPPTIEEQAAIAQMLSDLDAELLAIGMRLSKTRELKQGMMQDLLTGRTRLV